MGADTQDISSDKIMHKRLGSWNACMWTVCWSRSSGIGGECYWELWRRDPSRQTPGKKGAPECPAREQEEREEDHPFQGQPLTPGTLEWNEKKWKKTGRGTNFWQYHCFTQTLYHTHTHRHTTTQTQTHTHTHTHTHAPHIYTKEAKNAYDVSRCDKLHRAFRNNELLPVVLAD